MNFSGNPRVPRKLHIKTYGCQMNEYDSSRMADLLKPIGYELCQDEAGADLVILNTCHIREKAAEKVFSELGRLRQAKEEKARSGERMLIAVAGCVAQAQGAEIARRAPAVDMVVGPQSYHRLPEMIAKIERGQARALETEFPSEDKFDFLPEERAVEGVSAFLTVQEGCDKFCTFCVVPYTRGAEVSRPAAKIEREARRLVEKGVREITLLGQNVNAYHGEDENGEALDLARLIRRLAKIERLARLRYTTSHPRDMDDALIAAHGEIAALMPCLHLPVQSGSDRVLARMNRQHTISDYLRTVGKLRQARPGIALSSDFIVGFPGETDEDFASTLSLVRETGFAQAFSFKYSRRPGTPAAAEKQVDERVKSERLAELQHLLASQQRRFNEDCLGRRMAVLFERKGRYPGQLVGRSPYLQGVHAHAPDSLMNCIAEVAITGVEPNSLEAELVQFVGAPA